MAGSRTYRTKVLVLDKTKLKETDLILTMLDERGRQVRIVVDGDRLYELSAVGAAKASEEDAQFLESLKLPQ